MICTPDPDNEFNGHRFTDEELKKHDAEVRLDLLNTMTEFTGHVVNLEANGYSLQHPWKCRPDLIHCEVNLALLGCVDAPAEPGWYECRVNDDGALEIGEPVEPDTDPLFAYLLERYPED